MKERVGVLLKKLGFNIYLAPTPIFSFFHILALKKEETKENKELPSLTIIKVCWQKSEYTFYKNHNKFKIGLIIYITKKQTFIYDLGLKKEWVLNCGR